MNRLGLTVLRYWPLVLVFAIVQPWNAQAQSSSRVVVPAGTLIPVRIISRVSSKTATPGDTLNLRAASDVTVDGWTVVRKGAIGEGEIVASVPSNSHGQMGMLSLQMDWIALADGHRAHLSTQRATGDEAIQPQPMVIRADSGDVHLDGSLELPAFTNDNVVVVATARAAAEGDYAPTVATVPAATSTPESTPMPAPTPEPTPVPTPEVVETLPPRAPEPTPTTVPVPSPAPASPNGFSEGPTIFETRGTGARVTVPFSASGTWALTYTYDCSQQHGEEPSFSLRIAGAPIYIAPIERSDRRATGTVYVHQSGMFYLQIDTPCAWHVRAVSQALNSNVGWLGPLS